MDDTVSLSPIWVYTYRKSKSCCISINCSVGFHSVPVH